MDLSEAVEPRTPPELAEEDKQAQYGAGGDESPPMALATRTRGPSTPPPCPHPNEHVPVLLPEMSSQFVFLLLHCLPLGVDYVR